jgi:hypothetical protein
MERKCNHGKMAITPTPTLKKYESFEWSMNFLPFTTVEVSGGQLEAKNDESDGL